MKKPAVRTLLARFMSDYGMLLALLLLCGYYSWVTWDEQHPGGAGGAARLADVLAADVSTGTGILIVARAIDEDVEFAETLRDRLDQAGFRVLGVVNGQPIDARRAMERLAGEGIDLIACNAVTAAWPLFDNLGEKFPALAETRVVTPPSYWWPNFLKADNLLNIVDQIVVIAVIAIGMTMVIITAGIDLSVGSLIALSAVVATLLIRDLGGAYDATATVMVLCCFGGIAACALMGAFSGAMVTFFRIPPFIVTLALMLVARGTAFILAEGHSIHQVPATLTWLGRGTTAGIPNAIILMVLLYLVAHVVMTYTIVGRYVYAVGGNIEAARLSGVPIRAVLLLVYTVCGALAGLGGVVTASQLGTGSPTYGQMYELYVIAAVVVGGTSLAGGEGKVLGTLIGAFIIAVIRNGMNLTGVKSYTQDVVLGLVILGAVLLDMLKKRDWRLFRRPSS